MPAVIENRGSVWIGALVLIDAFAGQTPSLKTALLGSGEWKGNEAGGILLLFLMIHYIPEK